MIKKSFYFYIKIINTIFFQNILILYAKHLHIIINLNFELYTLSIYIYHENANYLINKLNSTLNKLINKLI